ncbi:MAG: steroid 5-alpha reductase family enzyme, partial [Planctomycetota bacterium]
EILVWLGVFVFSLSVLSGWGILIAFASPLYIFLLIRFVSGVPLLEKSAEKIWGSNPGYRKYLQKTSMLLPLPPKRD